MKKQFLSIVLATVLLSLVACEKKASPEEVKEALSSGTWNVSLYETDATPSFVFSDYDFTFASDGTASAHGDGTHVTGEWSISEVDGDNILELYLGHSQPFTELDAAWQINNFSSGRLETENDNDASVSINWEKN